jgi:hypothetical protein
MKGWLRTIGLTASVLALTAGAAHADVKTRNRSQVKFEGMLGRLVGIFGGKAAREGIESTSAVQGDRKASTTGTTERIVDLAEEKVYEVDLKKKSYTVLTFEEIRQQLREAQEKAAKDAEEARKDEKDAEKPEDAAKEVEVDFDVKETGQTKSVAGYDAREAVMTITVREKGKTLEDGGGLVVTSDLWLGPEIPQMKELADFEMRYWKAIAPEPTGLSPQQMATVMAFYPLVKQATDRMAAEQSKLRGTPLSSVTTFEAVKSKEQMSQQSEDSGSSGGGIGGLLARKMIKREEPKQRATFLTLTNETLEISTAVTPAELQIPADFKAKK